MVIETRQILEEFRLKNVLATSATGAVFLAADPDSGRDVVIKVISCAVPNAEDQVRRLFLEMVEAARSATVEAMPVLRDHGLTPEGDGFVVMDFVDGETLDMMDEVPVYAAVNILLDVLSCIEGLARVGSAHLNLKPSNIFVTNAPARDRATVLGFGTSATLLHAGVGVPVPADDPHLAPELVKGDVLPSSQAWRSDLFSLGVIACGILGAEIEADGTGRPRVTLPAGVRELLPEAEPLETVLGQIMGPDPFLRGDSPFEMRDSLIRALPDPPSTPTAAPVHPSPPVASFNPNRTDPAYEPPPEMDADAVSAAVDEDGWPEVLFDDPELPASLDDSEDTDVRNPVPVDVWVPETKDAAIAAAMPSAVPPGPMQPAGGRRVSRVEVGIVAVVVIILGSIIALTWSSDGGDEGPTVAPTMLVHERGESEALVPPPPDDNLFDDLLAIQQLVDGGALDAAREALGDLDASDGVVFNSDESALYDSLVRAVARAADRGAAIEDLRSGFAYGSVKMLRRGVAGLSGFSADQLSDVEGLAADLERARRVLRLHSEMWDAQEGGEYLAAIESAGLLEALLPGYSGSADLRNQAASALEARAEGMISDRQYTNAIAVLEGLRRVWPDHPTSAARIAWCEEQIDLARQGESMIEAALAQGEAGDPEGGLAALAAMSPGPGLQGAHDRARVALEARLAEMDAREPTIQIAGTVELGFKKNETIVVPLKVEDDYRVDKVIVHARNESDEDYLQIPLQADGEGIYSFTIDPELHGNKNVFFFVVAKDVSGHIGRFGSRDEPQTVTRKRWFKKLL
jgi:serine/threonine protein kinase